MRTRIAQPASTVSPSRRPRLAGISCLAIAGCLASCGVTQPVRHLVDPRLGDAGSSLVAESATTASLAGRSPSFAVAPVQPKRRAPSNSWLQVSISDRQLDEDLWRPVDQPVAVGAAYVYEDPETIGYELGLNFARDSESGVFTSSLGALPASVSFEALEVTAGVRKTFLPDAAIQPFVSAGFAFVTGDIEVEALGLTASENDSTAGLYARAGFLVPLGDRFRIGLDAKILRATDVNVSGFSGDVDYEQFGLVFEWSF